ncbi:MAG TPA: hypothetical protein VL442_20055 [Mucilaginibacter sp.]|jgi:hypothetical protein|nr:hypothetical protein [Mucilaginibacter sp.]
MKTIFIYLYLFISNALFAQSLSQTSQKIKTAYEELKRHRAAREKQLAYLKVFPQNKEQFTAIFDPDDFGELYSDNFKYIDAFISLAKNYPGEVIDKLINIGKNLKFRADATGQMQHSIVGLGNQYTPLFSKKLKALSIIEVDHLITFLADVENHKAYSEYQQLIESLQKIGENKLAAKFIRARILREKSDNH